MDDVDGCDGVGGGVAGVLGASDSDVMAEVLGVEITVRSGQFCIRCGHRGPREDLEQWTT